MTDEESKHCDDYIDDPSTPEVLRAFLSHGRSPGHGMGKPKPVMFATYIGKTEWMGIRPGDRVRVVMASRMGDVGVTKKLDAIDGYQARFFLDQLSEFSSESSPPRYYLTRDLELVDGDVRLVPGGVEINGVVVNPNGYRVNVRGTLFASGASHPPISGRGFTPGCPCADCRERELLSYAKAVLAIADRNHDAFNRLRAIIAERETDIREWLTQDDVRVREHRHAVTTPRESFDPIVLLPAELGPMPRLPPVEPRAEWFAEEAMGEPIGDVLDRAEDYRAWQREQAELPPDKRTPFDPSKRLAKEPNTATVEIRNLKRSPPIAVTEGQLAEAAANPLNLVESMRNDATIAEALADGRPCPMCERDPERVVHRHPEDM